MNPLNSIDGNTFAWMQDREEPYNCCESCGRATEDCTYCAHCELCDQEVE